LKIEARRIRCEEKRYDWRECLHNLKEQDDERKQSYLREMQQWHEHHSQDSVIDKEHDTTLMRLAQDLVER
jgi:hypothetical protein